MRRRLLFVLFYFGAAGAVAGCLWGAWLFFQDVRALKSQDPALVGVHSLINGCFICICLVGAGMAVQLAIDMPKIFTEKK